MANTITQQVINNGARNLTLKHFIENTGTASDESGTVLVDASSLGVSNLKLDRIQSSLKDFSAKLTWDGNTDSDILTIPEDDSEADFTQFGGIVNDAGSPTDDVKISTNGVGSNATGSIVSQWKKR